LMVCYLSSPVRLLTSAPFCFRLRNQRQRMTDVFCGDVSGLWTHINLPRLELSAKAGPNYCPRWAEAC
jgi:hypothetical protein